MTTETQTILKRVLNLNAVERAELIEAIFRSFDKSKDNQVDSAWAKEAESRVDAYESGKLKSRSAASVMRRINKRAVDSSE